MKTNYTIALATIAVCTFALVGCDDSEAEGESPASAESASAEGASAEAQPEAPAAPALVDVDVEGFGTIRLPEQHTVVEESGPSEDNHNIASAKFTTGEGDSLLTIQTEGTSGRVGVTDEDSARTVGRLLTRGGEVQAVTQLDNGNFEIHSVRESEEHYILVANDDRYIKCSTTNADALEGCRPIAQSLAAP